MAIESRSRMISFRLTAEEYERFRHVCISRGLRNVSELVRAAVNQLVSQIGVEPMPAVVPEIHTRVTVLETKVSDLSSALAHLERQLASSQPSALHTSRFAQSASGSST